MKPKTLIEYLNNKSFPILFKLFNYETNYSIVFVLNFVLEKN